jgi:hypothetical protein
VLVLCLPHGWMRFLPKRSARRCPRRISPHPSTRLGAAATSTEVSVTVLRAGTALSQQDPNPQQEVATRGDAKMSNLETYREKALECTRAAVRCAARLSVSEPSVVCAAVRRTNQRTGGPRAGGGGWDASLRAGAGGDVEVLSSAPCWIAWSLVMSAASLSTFCRIPARLRDTATSCSGEGLAGAGGGASQPRCGDQAAIVCRAAPP